MLKLLNNLIENYIEKNARICQYKLYHIKAALDTSGSVVHDRDIIG